MTWSRIRFALLVLAPALIIALLFFTEMAADFYRGFVFWIYGQQNDFHKSMTSALSAFADERGVSTGLLVVGGSFAYGVFHAAGPGHGKVILSAYLMTQPQKIGRSLLMAVAAAFLQGLVAVVLVYGLFYVFGLISRETQVAVVWSERLSYALVMATGAWLIFRAVASLRRSRQNEKKNSGEANSLMSGSSFNSAGPDLNSPDHDGACCDHHHFPSGEQIDRAIDIKSALAVIFSIGMRPCSGAVLVLIFARFAQIPLTGVLAVIAISAGTAITVSVLAFLAVWMRDFAMSVTRSSFVQFARIGDTLALVGGIVLVLIGYGLLAGSFSSQATRMLGPRADQFQTESIHVSARIGTANTNGLSNLPLA